MACKYQTNEEGDPDEESLTKRFPRSLHYALEHGCSAGLVRRLIESKNDVMLRCRRGRTPYHAAARGKCCLEVFKELVKYKEFINEKDHWDNTALHYALYNKCDPEVIYELICVGSDLSADSFNAMTPLNTAVSVNSCVETIKVLIDAGANILAEGREGNIALHTLVKVKGNPSIIKELIRNNYYSINHTNTKDVTPIMLSTHKNCKNIVFAKTMIKYTVLQNPGYAMSEIRVQSEDLKFYLQKCLCQVESMMQWMVSEKLTFYELVLSEFENAWTSDVNDYRDIAEDVLMHDQASEYFEEIGSMQQAMVICKASELLLFMNKSKSNRIQLDIYSSRRVVDFLPDAERFNLVLAFNTALEQSLRRHSHCPMLKVTEKPKVSKKVMCWDSSVQQSNRIDFKVLFSDK